MSYARGKLPASPLNPKAFRFGDIFHADAIAQPPTAFGSQTLIKAWKMFGNDEFGDCVWASKAHSHMLWSRMGGRPKDSFSTFTVLSDYAAATGFRSNDPSTDQGTDMQEAAEYHRKTGMLDTGGMRRTVNAYVHLKPGDISSLALAAYIFGAVEIGLNLPSDADDLFDSGKPWRITSAQPTGGHCVPIVGRDEVGNFICVTWGRLQKIEPAFLARYMDEAIAFLNLEMLDAKGFSKQAYDKPKLISLLSRVSQQPVTVTPLMAQGIADLGDGAGYPTKAQFDVAFAILRKYVNESGYGFMLSDEKLRTYSDAVAVGIVGAA